MTLSKKPEVPEGEPRARCPSVTSSRGSRKKRSNRKKKAKEWTCYIATLKSTIDCLYELCRTEQSINGCKEALMYIQNADRDFRSLIEAINLEQTFSKEVPQAVAWEIRKSASSPISTMILHEMQNLHDETEDGWQIVSHRKRKSLGSSTTTESVMQDQELPTDDQQNPPPPSVYERLSSGIRYRRNVVESRVPLRGAMSGKLMSPRCAMDLPQTRASLAKMSYVRQQIWEKDVKPSLTEKLARQKRERLQRIAAPTVSRINFSDPAAVRKRASEYSEQLKILKQTRSQDQRATRARSLHSINESGEGDGGEAGSGSSEGVPRSEPALPPVDIDAEWRELSEEERSLAIEEKSINEEIEKTESELESMDAEMVRQVMEEAEGHPIVEKEPSPPTTTTTKFDESKKTKKSNPLDEGIKNFLVNHVIGHIHEPGKMAERHEKMCSPKRRCEKDDYDFPRKQEEKLKRADAAREKLQQERTQKLKELAQRREEVLRKQAALMEKKRLYQEKRMERARENRERNLNDIVSKAKSDDHRVMEVQFINTLQDGVWRNELHERDLHLEERKQNLAEERAKKNEERAKKGKAAEDRRRKAEQNRVKKLQEKEEKKARQCELAWKKMCSKINVNSSSKDLPTGEFSLSSLVDRSKWPSSDVLSDPLICVLCSETMSRAFECFVHITGNAHLEKAGITPSSFTEDRLAKELGNLKVLARPSSPLLRPDSAKLQDRSLCLQDLIQYNFKRGNSQFNSTFCPPTASSPPPEALTKLLESVDLWSSAAPGDEEYSVVTDAVKCLEGEKEKTEREKLAAFLIPAADGMMKAVVAWDGSSTQLRFLIKMCSLIDRCSACPGFSLKCLFSIHLHSIFDKINAYSKDNSSSPHLSSLMDVCLCILGPFQRQRLDTIWGVAPETTEERLDCIYDMLSGFSSRIPSILSRGDSSAKWTRVHNLASFFMERGLNENSLPVIYIDHLLHETVEAFRVSTGVDSVDKATRSDSEVTGKLVNKVMHLSERIQQIRKPAVWSALFDRPSRSFRFFLILSELLRRSVHRSGEAGAVDLIPHLLFLLRCFAAHNPSHQIMCMVGGEKSVVSTICALSDEFFTVVPIAVQTVPTLVLITYENQYAVRKLMSKRCCSHIVAFIKNVSSTEPFRISLNHVLKEVDGEWASAIRFYQS